MIKCCVVDPSEKGRALVLQFAGLIYFPSVTSAEAFCFEKAQIYVIFKAVCNINNKMGDNIVIKGQMPGYNKSKRDASFNGRQIS